MLTTACNTGSKARRKLLGLTPHFSSHPVGKTSFNPGTLHLSFGTKKPHVVCGKRIEYSIAIKQAKVKT